MFRAAGLEVFQCRRCQAHEINRRVVQFQMASRPEMRDIEHLTNESAGPVQCPLGGLQVAKYTLVLGHLGIDTALGELHLSFGRALGVLDVLRQGIEERHVLILCPFLGVHVLDYTNNTRHLPLGILKRCAAHPGPDCLAVLAHHPAFHGGHRLAT